MEDPKGSGKSKTGCADQIQNVNYVTGIDHCLEKVHVGKVRNRAVADGSKQTGPIQAEKE